MTLEQIAIIAGLAVQGGGFAFMLGKHDNRLSNVEREASELKTKTDAHAMVIAGIAGMQDLLKEVRDDVKGLLSTGRTTRRGTGAN